MTAVSIMIVTCVRSAVVMGGSITIIVAQHRHTHEINIASSSFLSVAIFKELRIQEENFFFFGCYAHGVHG